MASQPVLLVTGGTGYLASHVVDMALRTTSWTVRTTARSTSEAALASDKFKHLMALKKEFGSRLELVAADLTDAGCWREVVRGCEFVAHVASPVAVSGVPKDENEMLAPAVQGTRNVLDACAATPSVRRVVVTSSRAAITNGHGGTPKGKPGYVFTEEDWSRVEALTPLEVYPKSKTLAERAAWEYMVRQNIGFDISVICPAFVVGPVFGVDGTSTMLVKRALTARYPMGCANINFNIVHTHDVALAHLRALTVPEAGGERFLLCGDDSMWMSDIARILAAKYRPKGYAVPTFTLPNWLLRLLALFDPMVGAVLPSLGKVALTTNAKARRVLGIDFKDATTAVLDCAASLEEHHLVAPPSCVSVTLRTLVAVSAAAAIGYGCVRLLRNL